MKLKMKIGTPKDISMELEVEFTKEEMVQTVACFKEFNTMSKESYLFVKEELKTGEIKTVIEKIQELIPIKTTTTVYTETATDSGETTVTEEKQAINLQDIMAKAKATFSKI